MDKLEFNEIVQMAQASKRDDLETVSPKLLVDALIKMSSMIVGSRYKQFDEILKIQRSIMKIDFDKDQVRCRIHDLERKLTETERERDKLLEENENLEDSLHQLKARVDELEQRLASVPQVGRPEKYDADFRAKVRAYYKEGHTYRTTADRFKISTNTVGRILKE